MVVNAREYAHKPNAVQVSLAMENANSNNKT